MTAAMPVSRGAYGSARQPLLSWIVRRRNCKKQVTRLALHWAWPNLKLRRVLELKGFKIETVAGIGQAYGYVHNVPQRDAEQVVAVEREASF
jgi:hypothetical protein